MVSSLHDLMYHMEILSVGDHQISACAGCYVGGCQFCRHASGTYRTSCAALCHFLQMAVYLLHHVNKFGVWVLIGVIGKEPVNIRQQDQHIGVHQSGYQCGKGIIVTKFTFIRGDGVVLIYNRDCPQIKQLIEGI